MEALQMKKQVELAKKWLSDDKSVTFKELDVNLEVANVIGEAARRVTSLTRAAASYRARAIEAMAEYEELTK
tara:strand:- start:957 stop:1172 length:216 start_codon:yes stop_codon:yes gene_type:complete